MKPTLYPSIDAFRAAGKDAGKVEGDAAVRASFDTEIKASEDEGSRSVGFTISTDSVDRMGDTIDQAGWQLEAYRKNPVVLWAHDSSSLPVGKAPKIWLEKSKLKADAEFTPKGMARFNDTVFDMVKGGFLNATSVGFAPLKYAFVDDPNRKWGIDFMEQELLEFSIVPVPANAEALVEGKAAGIEVDLLLDWAEKLIGSDAERVAKLADSVLGADGQDSRDIEWAKRIAEKAGMGLFSLDRLANIEKAATAQRIARRKREIEILRLKA